MTSRLCFKTIGPCIGGNLALESWAQGSQNRTKTVQQRLCEQNKRANRKDQEVREVAVSQNKGVKGFSSRRHREIQNIQ